MDTQLSFNFPRSNDYSFENFIVFDSNNEAFNYLLGDVLNADEEKTTALGLIIFLRGEQKSGKTHLAQLWKQKNNAKILPVDQLFCLKFEQFTNEINNLIEPLDYYLVDDFRVLNKHITAEAIAEGEKIEESLEESIISSTFEKDWENKLFHMLNLILQRRSSILLTVEREVMKYLTKNTQMVDLRSRIRAAVQLSIGSLRKDAKLPLLNKLLTDCQLNIDSSALKYLVKKLPTNYATLVNFVAKIRDYSLSTGRRIGLNVLKSLM